MAPPKNKAGNKKLGSPNQGSDAGGSKKFKEAQTINVRHILCEKSSKKEQALAEIEAGARFDEVARKFSEDKARQGGSLGWQTKASLDSKFAAKAFKMDVSTVNNPVIDQVKTQFGHHIIMVEGQK